MQFQDFLKPFDNKTKIYKIIGLRILKLEAPQLWLCLIQRQSVFREIALN